MWHFFSSLIWLVFVSPWPYISELEVHLSDCCRGSQVAAIAILFLAIMNCIGQKLFFYLMHVRWWGNPAFPFWGVQTAYQSESSLHHPQKSWKCGWNYPVSEASKPLSNDSFCWKTKKWGMTFFSFSVVTCCAVPGFRGKYHTILQSQPSDSSAWEQF